MRYLLLFLSFSAFAAGPPMQYNQYSTNRSGTYIVGNALFGSNTIAVGRAYANAYELAREFTNSATLWVDPTGNDTTARRGTREYPWKTPEYAATNALAGDTIRFNAGVFNCTNTWYAPTNGGVVGDGMNSTIIMNYCTNVGNAGPFPMINLSDNGLVKNLTIKCGYPNRGRYQAGLGAMYLAGQHSFTNAIVESVFLDGGDTDNLFVSHTNACSGVSLNCIHVSKWDANAFLHAAHQWDWRNCVSTSIGKTVFGGGTNLSHGLAYEDCIGGRFRFFGGSIQVSNLLARIVDAQDGAGATVELHGVQCTNSQPTYFFFTLSDKLIIDNCMGFGPTNVDNDTVATLQYNDAPPTTKITFGGNANSGVGPSISSTGPGIPLDLSGNVRMASLTVTNVHTNMYVAPITANVTGGFTNNGFGIFHTNGNRAALLFLTINMDDSDNNVAEVVVFTPALVTNTWGRVGFETGSAAGNSEDFHMTIYLNPNDRWYIRDVNATHPSAGQLTNFCHQVSL